MCTKVHFKPQNYNPKILQENHNHWEKKKNLLKLYLKKSVIISLLHVTLLFRVLVSAPYVETYVEISILINYVEVK